MVAPSLRKNDCALVRFRLQDSSGTPAPTPTPLSVAVSANGGISYRTAEGCYREDSTEEQSQFFIPPGDVEFSMYVRASRTGELNLTAQILGYSGTASSASPTVGFSKFSASRGANFSIDKVIFDASTRKLYIAGAFGFYDDFRTPNLARLNADGSFDSTFLQSGTGLNNIANAVAVQSNGRVVIAGSFSSYNGTPLPSVGRLYADGSLDTSFVSAGTGLNGTASAVAVQNDGKILVGGSFTTYNGIPRPRLARLNADGSLDTSFVQAGTGLSGDVNTIAIQADGKIVVAGFFTNYNGTTRNRIARLNSDGTLDTSFAPTGTGLNSFVNTVLIQPNGKILVGGGFAFYNGTARPYLARLNADGTLDTSFAQTGAGFSDTVNSLALQTDGKVIVGGLFLQYDATTRPYLARINADGTLDTGFAPQPGALGNGLTSLVGGVTLVEDDKIVVAGYFTANGDIPRNKITRLLTDGSDDATFVTTPMGFVGNIFKTATQADGKILVGGSFGEFNRISRSRLTRLNADGTLDLTFTQAGFGLLGTVYDIVVQPDGKILVGGNLTTYNGTTLAHLVRFNPDGTLDSSFSQTGTGLNSRVRAIALQPDGKILVGGQFTSYNGTARGYVARINANGSLDTSFVQTGTGFNSDVLALKLLPDGKIVVGGNFSTYNGSTRGRFARLNQDGSLDSIFMGSGSGFDSSVNAIAVTPEGKFVIGGNFTTFNGSSRSYLAQVNADGTLDSGFGVGQAPTSTVNTVTVDNAGKILVGGNFILVGAVYFPLVARLNSDGFLDPEFAKSGDGMSGTVYDLTVQPDQKILVGGSYSAYRTSTCFGLNRLTYRGEPD